MRRLVKHKLGSPFGGLNQALPPYLVEDTVSPNMDGFVLRPAGVETAFGWEKFTNQKLTDGAASPVASTVLKLDQYFQRNGTSYLVCITNKRAYYFSEADDLWIPITNGTKAYTTVNVTSNSGQKVLSVVSTTGYAVGDTIIINEGGARQETGVVDSISAGVSITLLANMTFTHTSAQADIVTRTYAKAIVDADSAAASTTLNVSHTTGFTVGEEILVGTGTARQEYLVITAIVAGVSLTVQRPTWNGGTGGLTYTHTAVQADKVYRLAGNSFTVEATEVDSENADNLFYWTDGVNPVQVWGATGTPTFSSNLAGLTSTDAGVWPSVEGLGVITSAVLAKYIRSFEGFLILGGLTEEGNPIPQKVRWSRFESTTSWVNNVDGSGQAGYFVFTGSDFIFRMQQLKRELLIYRERSVEGMSFVGPPDIFSFRRVETRLGLLAYNALIDLGDAHLILGPATAYAIDGMSAPSIADDIRKALFTALNPGFNNRCLAFYIEENGEAMFMVPTGTTRLATKAWVFSTLFKKWVGTRPVASTSFGYYKQQSAATWDGATGTWDEQVGSWDDRRSLANAPISLMGDNLGYVYKFDTDIDKDGSTWNRVFYTKVSDLDDPETSKRIMEVRIGLLRIGGGNFNVYLGTAENEGDDMTWSEVQSVSMAGDINGYAYFDQEGKYAQVRVETTTQGNLHTVEIGFIPRTDIL